jgi:SAM-dependent methyltransferase
MRTRPAGHALGEVRHLARALRTLALCVYLPLTILLTVIEYPYDTDASSARLVSAEGQRNAIHFYEAAYRPSAVGEKRGLDYEKTAASVAQNENVEGHVRAFVDSYQLHDKRVLDIGSGRGSLQDIVPNYTGLDLSSTVARYYHKPFVVGSATAMPFPDNSFDAAWTVWVVEHIPEPEKAFLEMRRVIKPGGVLFLMVAWNSTPWAAGGFEVRPFSDFNALGKVAKGTIPLRRAAALWSIIPIRAVRWVQYASSGQRENLRFRALQPNYDIYWQPDSDAAVSLDRFESLLWFASRGDSCLNCRTTLRESIGRAEPLVIRIKD